MRTTIAKNMVNIMKLHNRTTIWYGDIDLIEECAAKSNIHVKHPKIKIQYVLNALDKSNFFSKSYIISDINGQKRKYRCYKLRTAQSIELSN